MEWTGARYADGPTAEVTTWVEAAPEQVWAAVVDLAAMADASPELQSVEWLDGAGPALGARFVGRNRHEALGEWSATSYVVACDRPRVFAWAVADPDDPAATWRFTLEPAGGGTRLTEWVRLGPGRSGLSQAIERMPDKEQKIVFVRLREFEQNMASTLAAIKQRVEAGA
ncbi:MAG TPA: SRPBCC family protein [Pseudonocardia sp.]|nr:SRPBCC family protein [Pseudonocardia sp.]